jgi:hypothetical protein
MKKLLAALGLACAVLLTGCATNIKSAVTQNPPPAAAWSQYGRIELKPLSMGAPYAGQDANEAAKRKIQENIDARLNAAIAEWNASATGAGTIVIEPAITEIKFISGGSRFLAGAMAGSSAVILRARVTDADSGRVLATPEFYSKAGAYAGAYSFGGADNAMLTRIANRFADYVVGNYERPVGGPSGVGL